MLISHCNCCFDCLRHEYAFHIHRIPRSSHLHCSLLIQLASSKLSFSLNSASFAQLHASAEVRASKRGICTDIDSAALVAACSQVSRLNIGISLIRGSRSYFLTRIYIGPARCIATLRGIACSRARQHRLRIISIAMLRGSKARTPITTLLGRGSETRCTRDRSATHR